MKVDSRLESAAELLRVHGADRVDHPGGTLLDHLLRVRTQLEEWSAPPDVQLAGLCHAFYGTDGFGVALLETSQRLVLRQVIGHAAESLVYLYGSCDRGATYPRFGQQDVAFKNRWTGTFSTPSAASLRAFAEITAANELDVVNHSPEFADRYGVALVDLVHRMSRHLSGDALRAWRVVESQ